MPASDGPEWFDGPGGERVEILRPDRQWAETAAAWTSALRLALHDVHAGVEHIGSTAVPGLAAKPVVDLLLSVPSLDDETTYRPALESLGLVLRHRERDHRFFRPPAGRPRVVHVHVCAIGSRWERDHLDFRDVLRSRPDVAERYEALKVALAGRYADDRAAYNAGKTAFIASVLEDAASGVPRCGVRRG